MSRTMKELFRMIKVEEVDRGRTLAYRDAKRSLERAGLVFLKKGRKPCANPFYGYLLALKEAHRAVPHAAPRTRELWHLILREAVWENGNGKLLV